MIAQHFGILPPDVLAFPTTTECVNPDLVIGLELETENCHIHTSAFYTKLGVLTNFKVDQDGSLRGVAYEFISYPMKSTHALSALDKFFKSADFTDANYSDRCSVHVHVNCTDMTLEQVGCVALLYTTLEELLFEFVGGNRDTNIFCIPWNQCRSHFDLITKFLNYPSYTLRNWNKYTALNLIPLTTQGTIEFRQMHGTSDMVKLTQWINIIGAIFAYAKRTELNNLITQIKELNTNSHYEMFFNEVLGGQLPYDAIYSRKLEEGVIFAKYSLMSYRAEDKERAAPKPVKRKNTFIVDDFLDAVGQENGMVEEMRGRIAAQRLAAQVQAAAQAVEVQPQEERIAAARRRMEGFFNQAQGGDRHILNGYIARPIAIDDLLEEDNLDIRA